MAGLYVPLVLIPRYSTYSGASGSSFTTIGMDVTEYDKAVVSFWRSAGKDLTTFAITFEESMDQIDWSTCAGTFTDPGANTETQFTPTITKRFFRVKITISGSSNPVATCWCIGFLQQRET